MLPESFDEKQFISLHGAFDKACAELGIDDGMSRERLAQLMISLAEDGVQDPEVMRMLLHRMQPPIAGLSTLSAAQCPHRDRRRCRVQRTPCRRRRNT
jgi:hypothetical protein